MSRDEFTIQEHLRVNQVKIINDCTIQEINMNDVVPKEGIRTMIKGPKVVRSRCSPFKLNLELLTKDKILSQMSEHALYSIKREHK